MKYSRSILLQYLKFPFIFFFYEGEQQMENQKYRLEHGMAI